MSEKMKPYDVLETMDELAVAVLGGRRCLVIDDDLAKDLLNAARQQGRDERIAALGRGLAQIADWADEALNNGGDIVMVRRLEEIADSARALTIPEKEG